MFGGMEDIAVSESRLVDEVVAAALTCLPARVDSAVLTCNTVGAMSTFSLRTDGTEQPKRHYGPGPTDKRIPNAVLELRTATRNERGAFYVATIHFNRHGATRVSLDYDTEPMFRQPTAAATFADDLATHPRDPATYPEWLREKLTAPSEAAA